MLLRLDPIERPASKAKILEIRPRCGTNEWHGREGPLWQHMSMIARIVSILVVVLVLVGIGALTMRGWEENRPEFLLAAGLILVAMTGAVCLRLLRVPYAHAGVVIQNEKIHDVLSSGAHWYLCIPGIHSVRMIIVDTRETMLKLDCTDEIQTKDDQVLALRASAKCEIVDPVRIVTYGGDPEERVRNTLKARLKEVFSRLDSLDAYAAPDQHLERAFSELALACWSDGYELGSIKLDEIPLPASVRNAYTRALIGSVDGEVLATEFRERVERGQDVSAVKRRLIKVLANQSTAPPLDVPPFKILVSEYVEKP